jgi:hypothetical protein
MGGDDQVPSRISGSDAQVREELVLDRSLAPANEVKVSTLSRPDCPSRRAVADPSQRFRPRTEVRPLLPVSVMLPPGYCLRWVDSLYSSSPVPIPYWPIAEVEELVFVITALAQDPIVWLAGVLSTYCALLAVVLRTEWVARNRNTYLSPGILEKSMNSE